MCSTKTTKFGNKTRSLLQNKTERKLDSLRAFYFDVLLSVSWYGIDVVVVVAFILFTELLYFCDFVTSVVITQFLTGCLCALNYMSKLDHLIYKKRTWFCPHFLFQPLSLFIPHSETVQCPHTHILHVHVHAGIALYTYTQAHRRHGLHCSVYIHTGTQEAWGWTHSIVGVYTSPS